MHFVGNGRKSSNKLFRAMAGHSWPYFTFTERNAPDQHFTSFEVSRKLEFMEEG